MKITPQELQKIIREEVVKSLFESRGRKLTLKEERALLENLDEGLFDDILGAFKSKGKSSQDQDKKNEEAILKTEQELKKEILAVQQKADDMLLSNGYVSEDRNEVAVLGIDLFRAAVEEVMSATKISGQVKSSGNRQFGMGKYRNVG